MEIDPMNKTHEKTPGKAAKPPKSAPPAPNLRPAPPREPSPEPTARALERAEGEGMVAPASPPQKGFELEGEGNYTAARRYDEGVSRSVADGKTAQLGEEAAHALNGPEGDELRKAAAAAKQGHSN
jgi:hypothetical protein